MQFEIIKKQDNKIEIYTIKIHWNILENIQYMNRNAVSGGNYVQYGMVDW